jgi:hypothetical protein
MVAVSGADDPLNGFMEQLRYVVQQRAENRHSSCPGRRVRDLQQRSGVDISYCTWHKVGEPLHGRQRRMRGPPFIGIADRRAFLDEKHKRSMNVVLRAEKPADIPLDPCTELGEH